MSVQMLRDPGSGTKMEPCLLGSENGDEDYFNSIELSNSCRQFYLNRLRVSENHKQQLKKYEAEEKVREDVTTSKSSMQTAMETLRKEMTSLMDQDLSLMEQLLTLNEAIEELKSRKLNAAYKDTLRTSSCDIVESNDSIQNTLCVQGHLTNSCDLKRSSDSVQDTFFMDGSMLSPFEGNSKQSILPSKTEINNDIGFVQSTFFMDGSMLTPFETKFDNNVSHSDHDNDCVPNTLSGNKLPPIELQNEDDKLSLQEESRNSKVDCEFRLKKSHGFPCSSFHKDVYELKHMSESFSDIGLCNDSGYDESGSDQDYTGTTL